MSENGENEKAMSLQQRVELVVHDCIRRRAVGEVITDETLITANPDLMPALAEQLRNLQVIEQVHDRFEGEQLGSLRDVRSRCPHCRNPVVLAEGTPLSNIVCSACGEMFNLVDDTRSDSQPTPERVGQFHVLERLGAGAFGTVWTALDTTLDRLVAVKVSRTGQVKGQDAEKFFREARAIAQLHHPNIVQVLEVGRDGDNLFIAMEFVAGENLAEWLAHRQPTAGEAVAIVAKLAAALDHAHQHGVIHRDVKPSNIVIQPDDGWTLDWPNVMPVRSP